MSLRPDGHYFSRIESRNFWCLDDDAVDHIGLKKEAKNENDPVEQVWLGYDGSYVAQRSSGQKSYDLKGHYGSLGQTLKYPGSKIAALGLNLTNGSGYFLMLEDGTNQCNPGGCLIDRNAFRRWVQATFS